MTLPVRHRNAIFEAVVAAGLAPGDFEIHDFEHWAGSRLGRCLCSALRHKASGFFFEFGVDTDRYDELVFPFRISPGPDAMTGTHMARSLDEQVGRCRAWIQHILKPELDQQDFWEVIAGSRDLIAASAASSLTDEWESPEHAEAARKLVVQLRAHIAASCPEISEVPLISERLANLERAVTRMGPKDWIILAWGTICSLAPTIGPVALHSSLQLFGELGRSLFSAGPDALLG